MFELVSKYKPSGDQPSAIKELVQGLKDNKKHQVLLGATGTGKTFTIANVIANINKPTLVFAHNKTLAGQLYSEFKELFPNNRVEYFVSNFDYYQPEAYMPKSDTFIEKTAMINDELDMLRLSTINSLLNHQDTIVVASVACIYASSNPDKYKDMFFTIKVDEKLNRDSFLTMLVQVQYSRNDYEIKRGTFKVSGDIIDIYLGYHDNFLLRVEFYDDYIERITEIDPITKKTIRALLLYSIFPASGYARKKEDILKSVKQIEIDLKKRIDYFDKNHKEVEKQRLNQRTLYDIEALKEFGICRGIENYSLYIDQREPNSRPYNIFDYFQDDFLLVIDESHASIPQIKGMYFGDRSRKETLVEYGFRLPSALDNRPMTFEEFESVTDKVIYVSATPGDYELDLVNNKVIEQIIRPTGLIDPIIEIRPTLGQIDDIIYNIKERIKVNERVLITALTVKMAEELTKYLELENIKVAHLHHEIKTLQRIETILSLRKKEIDVIVGINLLREGLDIPEVSLIMILDADKEGFLRSYRSLIQTIGRAARNVNGKVIMYADKVTESMSVAIEETKRRRKIQQDYNDKYNIIPKTIIKDIQQAITSKETKEKANKYLKNKFNTKAEKEVLIKDLTKEMKEAAKVLDFERACELRDIILEIRVEN